MNTDNDVNVSRLVTKLGLNRRQFLAATTGMAAAAAVTAPSALAGPVGTANGILIPAPRRGIILYTVRDAISPQPADLGPRLRLQGGARGARRPSATGRSSSRASPRAPNAEGGANLNTVEGATLLRSWLDANGLEAEGNHGSIPSTVTDATIAQFDAACEIANILGMGHIGTGNDPTGSAFVADWEAAAERWNFFGERASSHGLKLYTHNHDIAYSFLLDSGPLDALGRPTRSSGIRRLEHFLANTDPKHVYLEMDIYWAHVAQYKHRTLHRSRRLDGGVDLRPGRPGRGADQRYPLFHAKDGRKDTTQANGYVMAPFGEGDIDYSTFLRRVGAKGSHNPMWEQDTAPGGTAAPGAVARVREGQLRQHGGPAWLT